MNSLQAAMVKLATKGNGTKSAFVGIWTSMKNMFGMSGKIITSVGAQAGVFARLAQVIFGLGGIFAGLFRILLRFAGPAGIFFAIAEVIDFVVEKFTGFSIIDWD